MVFPYAFRRAYLAKPTAGALVVQTSGTTDVIQAGQFGFCTAPNGIEGSFINAGTATTIKMVTGSYHSIDKIAPFYGGLQAPLYSKAIDPRRVVRFIKSTAIAAKQQIVSIGWDQTSGSTVGPLFYCGVSYPLRLDFIGSPALRLLNHNIYVNLPAYGGCCGTDCSSGCTSTAVDAAFIMLQWKDFILAGSSTPDVPEVPYLKQFFLPQVFIKNGSTKQEVFSAADVAAGRDGGAGVYTPNTANPTSVIASFQLTGAYVDTKYGNCTFTPSDYFETEPIFCKASLVTQDYSACEWNTTINSSVPNMFTVLQSPAYPKGLGEQVVRELIQTMRYKQDHLADSIYVDSLRMREIEDQNWMINNVDRSAYYDVIAIAYNKNSSNTEQSNVKSDLIYWEAIYVPTGTDTSAFTTLFQACLTAASNGIAFEQSGTAVVNGVTVPTGI